LAAGYDLDARQAFKPQGAGRAIPVAVAPETARMTSPRRRMMEGALEAQDAARASLERDLGAKLISKMYQADPIVSKGCGGPLMIVAYITDEISIARILEC
jgi:hypothetical protein